MTGPRQQTGPSCGRQGGPVEWSQSGWTTRAVRHVWSRMRVAAQLVQVVQDQMCGPERVAERETPLRKWTERLVPHNWSRLCVVPNEKS